MSNIYLGAGKGDTPRSCNSEAYLKNYDAIFRNARRKQPDENSPTSGNRNQKNASNRPTKCKVRNCKA